MEAKELRIGNYLRLMLNHSEYNYIQVELPDLNLIHNNNSKNEYYPIRITEEWLLKFGFEHKAIIYIIRNGS
ncbi:hypothetical protein CMU26_01135 [Elizabethkingia anophelis]|nr:hypothetical protein [Elizabethkingia anophelis]